MEKWEFFCNSDFTWNQWVKLKYQNNEATNWRKLFPRKFSIWQENYQISTLCCRSWGYVASELHNTFLPICMVPSRIQIYDVYTSIEFLEAETKLSSKCLQTSINSNLGTWIQILIVEGFVLLLLSKDMFENSKICQKKKNYEKFWQILIFDTWLIIAEIFYFICFYDAW